KAPGASQRIGNVGGERQQGVGLAYRLFLFFAPRQQVVGWIYKRERRQAPLRHLEKYLQRGQFLIVQLRERYLPFRGRRARVGQLNFIVLDALIHYGPRGPLLLNRKLARGPG